MQAIRGYVKGGLKMLGMGRCGTHAQYGGKGSTGRFCDFKCPAIETSTGNGPEKYSPAEDILRPRRLIHELSPYLRTNFLYTPYDGDTPISRNFNFWL